MKQGKKLALRLCVLLAVVIAAVAICVVSFATGAEPADGPVCYQHGDVNGDGAVDSRDAIYTLYNVLLGEDSYPAGQDLDFNGDAHKDSRDAIYVLYAYMNEEDPNYQYKLDGLVHNYFDPVWKWEGNVATVTLKCGCGEVTTLTTGNGVTVTEGEKQAATCIAAGFTTYEATVDNMDYTDTKKVTVPAGNGHSMVGTQDCENGSACQLCDYALEPLGHQWKAAEDLSVKATCTVKGVQGYRCEVCGQSKTVEQEGSVGHQYAYLEGQDLNKGGCLYVKQYQCAVCETVTEGTAASDSYSVHSYKATLTKEATCKQEGEKTYTCVNGCGHSYTEAVATNDSHAWDEGVQGDGVMLYTCTDCGETKTTVSVTADTAVSKEQLSSELQLENDAAMTMDQSVVENLDANREIKISVETVDVDELETDKALSAEEKAQIGGNAVYDFSMVYADNNDKVEFVGEITVSLPYTLQPGDDIDSIDVWFISDNGDLEQVNGTYSNGFVTFTTDHFSYYTVTRLTPAQRCARYGHIPVEAKKQATCTEDGYTMSVCQRCAAELAKEVYKMFGHDFKTEETAATCTAEGQIKQTCNTCGHAVTQALPALGHVLQADPAQTVTASCTTAGKSVYVCTRSGCDYIREDAEPQLEHVYKDFEDKAADCSNKGYKTQKCELCQDVKTVDETAPLGHKFTNAGAVWSWNDDNSGATLVLTCAHDKAHTKTLTAVVTETVTDSTCTGNGAVTYTAEAAYNNYIFKDEKVITQDAPGHMPGAEWESDSGKHYHVCTVCKEKVDAAAHNWNSGTVTKAPTCADSGIKQVKCTVCGYSKEQVIPATGVHSFVNGVCSVCGFKEGSCEHLALKKAYVDVSSFGICGEAKIMRYSCDCGEVDYCYVEKLDCKFDEDETVTVTAPNGQQIKANKSTCGKCGMELTDGNYRAGRVDPCMGGYYRMLELKKDGKVLLQSSRLEHETAHLGVNKVASVDLTTAEYGMCAEKLEILECACGQVQQTVIAESCEREWAGTFDGEGDENYRYYCEKCDSYRNYSYTYEDISKCESKEISKCTYERDGEVLYSYTSQYFYLNHEYEALSCEMMGDSCEDGMVMHLHCVDCDDTTKSYADWHRCVMRETTDLSSSDICYSAAVQMYCPCGGVNKEYNFVGENRCTWNHINYDEKTKTDTYECGVCHAIKTEQVIYGEKDENCSMVRTFVVTLKDKNGKELASVCSQYMTEEHNMNVSGELFGDSCEDGVVISQSCKDCDYSYSYTTYDHVTEDLQRYQLADYGMCGGEIVVRGCMCGKDVWMSTNNSACEWRFVGGEEFAETYQCIQCGVQRRESWEEADTDHVCIKDCTTTMTYTKDEKELLCFSYTWRRLQHEYTHKLTLHPGATSCEQGFTVESTCEICGYTEQWDEYWHETYPVSRRTVGEGVMCSAMVIEEYSCACGQEHGTNWDWVDYDNSCSYNEHYDYDLDCWVMTCTKCGVQITSTYEETLVEGETCRYIETGHYVYSKDGEELFSYDSKGYYTRHNNTVSFEMLGEHCDDGYYVTWTCETCGYTKKDEGVRYGCETYTLERAEAYSGDGICGPVYAVRRGCPCGNYVEYDCDYSCSFDDYGYDSQLGAHMLKCRKCDVLQTNSWNTQEIEGSCMVNRTMSYRFFLNGEQIVDIHEQWTEEEHRLVYDHVLHGETCEDGYDLTYQCRYCDYSGSETNRYGHNTVTTQYYELSDYGICDGYIQRRNCACELYSNRSTNINCSWDTTGKIDPETGAYERYCEECGTYWYYLETESIDRENCQIIGTTYYKFTRDGQTLLEATIPTKRTYHDWQIENTTLTNPELGCDGGFEVTLKCENCGETESEWGNEHYYYTTETIFFEELGACGGKVVLSECPCGKYADTDRDWKCAMEEDWDSTGDNYNGTSKSVYTCRDCGLVYSYENSWSIPEGACTGITTVKETATMGDMVKELNWQSVYENHTYVLMDSQLDDPSMGCMGGYTNTFTCMFCDDSYTSSGSSSHNQHLVERLDLSGLGACGGTVSIYRCPCGQMSRVEGDLVCEMASSGDGDGSETSGYTEETHICNTCGLQIVDREEWTIPEGGCQRIYNQTYTVTMGDEVRVLEAERMTWNHLYKASNYVLNDPELGCEGGYSCTKECIRCGDSYNSTGSWHSTEIVEYLDLKEFGACGGYVALRTCACGWDASVSTNWACSNTDYDYDHTGDNHNGSETRTYTCRDCGMAFTKQETWSIPEGSCTGTRSITATVTLGEKVENFSATEKYVQHEWEMTYTLASGAVSCEDGVDSYGVCKYCDATTSGRFYWHESAVVETFDLRQYGSVCGGTLQRRVCACGERQSMQFADTQCDLSGARSISVWIDDIVREGQYTSEEWIYLDTYANEFICAVTDPQCGLHIRNANYWLKNGCEVTEYQTWQLGYDEQSGTCQKEITFPTGRVCGYHTYSTTELEEVAEDGSRMTGASSVCDDCGSTYYWKDWYNAEGQRIKSEQEAVNTLNNGENKRWYEVDEYITIKSLEGSYYTRTTLDRREYTYADGRQYWYQNAYTYDIENGCIRTSKYSDSEGNYSTDTSTAHSTSSSYEYLREPTCSQTGVRHWTKTCYLCGEVVEEYDEAIQANDHYFQWDYSKGTYRCWYCNIENSNGSSGAIIMEDLSNDKDYIVGYCNKEDLEFRPYVSVILYDVAEDENDELVLEFNVYRDLTVEKDGICALAYNREKIDMYTGMAIAEAGYTGSYAVRISFVPVNSDDTLDYAVTFDTQYAQ